MMFSRQLIPDWHKEEKEFLECYVNLIKNFTYNNKRIIYELVVDKKGNG